MRWFLVRFTEAVPVATRVRDEVHRLFRQATLEAVIAVAEKHGLPRQELYPARAE